MSKRERVCAFFLSFNLKAWIGLKQTTTTTKPTQLCPKVGATYREISILVILTFVVELLFPAPDVLMTITDRVKKELILTKEIMWLRWKPNSTGTKGPYDILFVSSETERHLECLCRINKDN